MVKAVKKKTKIKIKIYKRLKRKIIVKKPIKICLSCGRKTYKGEEKCHKCNKRNYNRRYYRNKYEKKAKAVICFNCKTREDVMPFKGLCRRCNKLLWG